MITTFILHNRNAKIYT